MALSDCEKCWDTPCGCGWYFKNYGIDGLSEYILRITGYRPKKDRKQILQKALELLEKEDNKND
jgi:hypothetical protein